MQPSAAARSSCSASPPTIVACCPMSTSRRLQEFGDALQRRAEQQPRSPAPANFIRNRRRRSTAIPIRSGRRRPARTTPSLKSISHSPSPSTAPSPWSGSTTASMSRSTAIEVSDDQLHKMGARRRRAGHRPQEDRRLRARDRHPRPPQHPLQHRRSPHPRIPTPQLGPAIRCPVKAPAPISKRKE